MDRHAKPHRNGSARPSSPPCTNQATFQGPISDWREAFAAAIWEWSIMDDHDGAPLPPHSADDVAELFASVRDDDFMAAYGRLTSGHFFALELFVGSYDGVISLDPEAVIVFGFTEEARARLGLVLQQTVVDS